MKKSAKQNNVRDELIAVGLQLLLDVGYMPSSIKDVVSAAGVPKGSFYYYFDSKEAFAREVIARYAEQALLQRQQVLGDQSLPPLQRLRQFFELYIEYFTSKDFSQGCLFGNLSLEIGDHSELLRSHVRAGFAEWEQAMRDVFEEASQRGDLPAGFTAEHLAAFCINSWEGALVRMRAERSETPLRLFIHTVFDQLLKKAEV